MSESFQPQPPEGPTNPDEILKRMQNVEARVVTYENGVEQQRFYGIDEEGHKRQLKNADVRQQIGQSTGLIDQDLQEPDNGPWSRLKVAESELTAARKAVSHEEASNKLSANKWESRMKTHMAAKNVLSRISQAPYHEPYNPTNEDIKTLHDYDLQNELDEKHGLDKITEDDELYYQQTEKARLDYEAKATAPNINPPTPPAPRTPITPPRPPKTPPKPEPEPISKERFYADTPGSKVNKILRDIINDPDTDLSKEPGHIKKLQKHLTASQREAQVLAERDGRPTNEYIETIRRCGRTYKALIKATAAEAEKANNPQTKEKLSEYIQQLDFGLPNFAFSLALPFAKNKSQIEAEELMSPHEKAVHNAERRLNGAVKLAKLRKIYSDVEQAKFSPAEAGERLFEAEKDALDSLDILSDLEQWHDIKKKLETQKVTKALVLPESKYFYKKDYKTVYPTSEQTPPTPTSTENKSGSPDKAENAVPDIEDLPTEKVEKTREDIEKERDGAVSRIIEAAAKGDNEATQKEQNIIAAAHKELKARDWQAFLDEKKAKGESITEDDLTSFEDRWNIQRKTLQQNTARAIKELKNKQKAEEQANKSTRVKAGKIFSQIKTGISSVKSFGSKSKKASKEAKKTAEKYAEARDQPKVDQKLTDGPAPEPSQSDIDKLNEANRKTYEQRKRDLPKKKVDEANKTKEKSPNKAGRLIALGALALGAYISFNQPSQNESKNKITNNETTNSSTTALTSQTQFTPGEPGAH